MGVYPLGLGGEPGYPTGREIDWCWPMVGCWCMAFSMLWGGGGYTPDSIDTKAVVTLTKQDDEFAVTAVGLTMSATIPGIDQKEFDEIAGKAKSGCPISKLLKADISLDGKLG